MQETESDEDVSSEEEFFGCKFMPIQIPEDFDPNKIPATGEEYLHHAMYEAKMCQTIATGNIDFKKFKANQTFSVEEVEHCAEAPKSLIPTQRWQKQTIEEFTCFRKYVASRLPELADIDNCDHAYWIQKMDNEYPTFSVVSGFNTHAQRVLLDMIMKKLCKIKDGDTISNTMGCWIYSILNVLQIPLNPSIYSVLRNLARECALIRSKLSANADPMEFKHLNLFICIIGKYFGQYDLADK